MAGTWDSANTRSQVVRRTKEGTAGAVRFAEAQQEGSSTVSEVRSDASEQANITHSDAQYAYTTSHTGQGTCRMPDETWKLLNRPPKRELSMRQVLAICTIVHIPGQS
jgi:hypothetical protein